MRALNSFCFAAVYGYKQGRPPRAERARDLRKRESEEGLQMRKAALLLGLGRAIKRGGRARSPPWSGTATSAQATD